LGVAHNSIDHGGPFNTFLNEQSDRDHLISYLKAKNQKISYLILNQPFKLRPTVDDPLNANSDDEKDESQIAQLKEKVSILVETPLFTISDFKEADLFTPDSKVILLQHPQAGIMQLYKASYIQVKRNIKGVQV
jgi:hypothetical protein